MSWCSAATRCVNPRGTARFRVVRAHSEHSCRACEQRAMQTRALIRSSGSKADRAGLHQLSSAAAIPALFHGTEHRAQIQR